jgi:hypothetical protein
MRLFERTEFELSALFGQIDVDPDLLKAPPPFAAIFLSMMLSSLSP